MPKCPFARAFLGIAVFSLAGSVLSRTTGLEPGWIAPLASLAMLVCGTLAVIRPVAQKCGSGQAWLAWGCVVCVGAGVEVLGLYTGFPFGDYVYTAAWWPTVSLPGEMAFPLALPLAWSMMAGASYLVAARWTGRVAAPLVGGLIAATADLALEPVMAGPLGYWRWLETGPLPGGAPWSNFLGWFGATAAAGVALSALGAWRAADRDEPAWVLGGFVAFVMALGWVLTL